MKKTLALLLIVSIIFSFVGCTKRELKYAKEPDVSMPGKGEWNGNLYTNDYADITFEMPEDFIKATDEELSKVEAADGVYYDLMCQKKSTGSQVTVMTEELLLTEGIITITEDEYIEKLSEAFSSSGMIVLETGDVTLSGEGYKSITVCGESDEFKVTQCSLVRKKGNTMISVIATALGDDKTEDLLKLFK